MGKSTKSKGISDEARRLGVSRQAVWQKRNVLAGRCSECAEPRINSEHCNRHAEVKRLGQAKRRRKLIAAGLCTYRKAGCRRRAAKGLRACRPCLDKHALYYRGRVAA